MNGGSLNLSGTDRDGTNGVLDDDVRLSDPDYSMPRVTSMKFSTSS